MTDPDPTERDDADAAKRIEEAGVADEGAAYTTAIAREAPAPADESAAHPS